MEQWCEIRQRVLRDGESIRQIQRETGLHFDTIKKILAHPTPPAFRTPVRVKPKLGPYLERIAAILDSDRELPRKQRHTAKRIFERLRDEGYSGGYTQVKEAVRELKRSGGEVFVPLVQEPGEAQVGFGYALVKLAGSLSKVAFFALELPYSDAMFIAAYPRECTETFQDGHVRAFGFLQGVPRRIGYDNARTSVAQITGARRRKLTTGFLQLQSHYLFDECFCRVGRPNEKGVVEGIVENQGNILLMGNPGTGKTHLATALGQAACRQGKRVRFFSLTALVTQLLESREDRQLERFLKRLEKQHLLILDEFGYVPFSKAGAELLFEVVSRAYERTSLILTTNLPFEHWTEVLGNERLTGALLDQITHRVHIIEANGESYRLRDAKKRARNQRRKQP